MGSGSSDCRRAGDRVSLRARVGPESQAVPPPPLPSWLGSQGESGIQARCLRRAPVDTPPAPPPPPPCFLP